jgi:hypothetical protein
MAWTGQVQDTCKIDPARRLFVDNQFNHPPRMIQPESLSDEELAQNALEWRRRALGGEHAANGLAHELEREMRRRAGALSTLGAALREPAVRRKPWWRFWT